MSRIIQFKRFGAAALANTIGANGEIIFDITNKALTVHDGVTAGGFAALADATARNLANAAFSRANSANVLAQASFDKANTASAGFDKANAANVLAQAAFNQANSANVLAQSSYNWANTINVSTQASFTQANLANVLAQAAFNAANTANAALVQASFDKAKSSNVLAQSAFNQANSANVLAQAAFNAANAANSILAQASFDKANVANTTAEAGFAKANAANVLAQSAYNQANSVYLPSATRLDVTNNGMSAYLFDQYTGDNATLYVTAGETISFNLNVTGHPFLIRISSSSTLYNIGLTHVTTTGVVTTNSSAQGQVSGTLYWKVPSVLAGNTYVYQCQVHAGMVGNIVIGNPNQATIANTTAEAGFAKANIANTTAEAGFAKANIANTTAEAGFAKANIANTTAEAGFAKANIANTTAEAGFAKANVANTTAEAGFSKANLANVLAQSAFTQANTSAQTVPQNAQTTNYILQLSDAGKHIYYTQSSNVILYVPTTSNVAFSNGSTIMIVSRTSSSANITVSPNTGVSMYLAGNTTSASRNVTTYGMATLIQVAANTWFINGTGVS